MRVSMKSKVVRSDEPVAEPVDDELVMADIEPVIAISFSQQWSWFNLNETTSRH